MKTQSNPPSGAPSRYSLAFAAAAAGILPVGAAPIAVPNPSFEARAITDGQDVYNQSSTDSWRHWWRTENGGPCRILNPGISGTLRPNGLSTYVYGFGGTPPEGAHLLMVRSRYSDVATTTPPQSDGINYFSAGVVLLDGVAEPTALASAPFDPTKVYKLTATVGKPIVFLTMPAQGSPVFETDPRTPQDQVWFGYALQLAVGGSKVNSSGGFSNSVTAGAVIAQDANAVSLPVDNFRTVTTTYFPNPADAGGTGEFLQLRLCALDNPANLAQTGHVAYDNIKLEEFAAPALAYWDLNDTGVGAGGAAPTGTWDGASNQWSTSADGTSATAVWTPGATAVFSAGTDATGPYSITVSGSPNIGGLAFKNGDVTLTGGTALELAGIGMVSVGPGLTATVETPITQVSPGLEIAKTGTGTLVLSSANTYSGGTTVLDGTLRLAAGNVLADTSVVSIFGRSTGNATFDLNGNSDTIGGLVLGGSAVDSAAVVATGAGTLTLGGDVAYVNAAGNGGNPLGATISGKLDLGAAARTFVINDSASAAADLSISADLSGSVQMTKEGRGTLILSGNNAAATGDLILTEGLTRVDSLASLNGAANDVTITAPGALAFGPSFGTGNIITALSTRIAPTSNGIIAADNQESHHFDFGAAGLTTFLGAVGNVTYTGSITPEGTTYRLGGGGGTLTVAGVNALTGSGKSAIIGGLVSLPGANNYDGGTTLLSGTVALTIGSDGSVGTGPLTFAGGTLQGADASTRTLANAIVTTGTVRIGGTGNFAFTDTAVSNLGASRTFVIDNPVTSFAQIFDGTGAGITKSGTGTMILTGNNTHGGGVTLSAGTLVIGSASALGTGTLTLSAGTFDTAAGLTATTTNNPVNFNGNFTFGGTENLSLGNGAITNGGSRIITINGTNRTLTFGGLMTNNLNNIQTTTVNGAGNTLVLGGYALAQANATNRIDVITGDGNVTITGPVTNGLSTASGLTKNGTGTLTLQGANTYTAATTVNTGTLALSGGSQESAITVKSGAFLEFPVGSSTTSTKAVTLEAGAKIRITGTPTAASHTLLTTTASISGISGNLELVNLIPGYDLAVENGNTLKLVARLDPDYLAWTARFPGKDLGNPNADLDGDGRINDDERIFGLDPTNGASNHPISVPLNPATGTLSFTRRDPALAKYLHSVWTSTTLTMWTEDTGAVLVPGPIVDEVQTVSVQLSPGLLTAPKLFVRIRAGQAPPPPPILAADFESDDGGFTVMTNGGTPWAYGDPESPDGGGGPVTAGNGGSAKCWGTNLTGAYGPGTNTSLRSPVIDLTSVTAANLSFARALDADAGHTLEVNVIDDTTDTVIANIIPAAGDTDILTANWQTIGPVAIPAAAFGQAVRIEWRFVGDGSNTFLGSYIDDVMVTKP